MNLGSLCQLQPLANQTKSTVLQPLLWLMVLLFSALLACLFAKAPDWILVVVVSMVVLDFLLILIAYTFYSKTNPEFLRTEQFLLRKLEIEYRITGDSDTGIIDGDVIQNPLAIAPQQSRTRAIKGKASS